MRAQRGRFSLTFSVSLSLFLFTRARVERAQASLVPGLKSGGSSGERRRLRARQDESTSETIRSLNFVDHPIKSPLRHRLLLSSPFGAASALILSPAESFSDVNSVRRRERARRRKRERREKTKRRGNEERSGFRCESAFLSLDQFLLSFFLALSLLSSLSASFLSSSSFFISFCLSFSSLFSLDLDLYPSSTPREKHCRRKNYGNRKRQTRDKTYRSFTRALGTFSAPPPSAPCLLLPLLRLLLRAASSAQTPPWPPSSPSMSAAGRPRFPRPGRRTLPAAACLG